MRILRIIKSVDPVWGGPVEAMLQTARLHNEAGHVVEVLSMDDPSSDLIMHFPIRCNAVGPAPTRYGYTRSLNKWLLANAGRYDCFIIEGLWQYHCWGAWRSIRNSGIPYVVFTHGMLAPWFKMRYPLKHLKKWLYWPWADYRVLRDAAAVLFTCDQERVLARQSFWLYRAREVVVSSGTAGVPDTKKDYASGFLLRHPGLHEYRRFVFLGRLHPVKGADIIVETIGRLRRCGLWDSNTMRLIMAGPDTGTYGGKLKELAQSLGVADSIVWTGMLSGDDKWGVLQCAEVFVLPSHQENFGVVVAESLSVGVPVLISKAVNIWPEIVADGAGTADDDTVAGFERQMISWLMLSPDAVAAMRKKARLCFGNRYTAKRAADSLLSVIYQITGIENPGVGKKSASNISV